MCSVQTVTHMSGRLLAQQVNILRGLHAACHLLPIYRLLCAEGFSAGGCGLTTREAEPGLLQSQPDALDPRK